MAELSVSKTYIKLKDLILEKKALQKETNKMKTLNCHLERRLDEQQKRLSTVSLELTKTWHLVGKMQRQHRQLHTNEQILRYQLHQKRRLLNELKDELEYCRKKWAAARAKNAESQVQCDDLRKEFAKRKLEDANLSGESGYSDGPISDEEDEQLLVKKNFEELFASSRKIERMQSASPTRTPLQGVTLRGKSAPPTNTFLTEFTQMVDEISTPIPLQNIASSSIVSEKPVAAIAETPSRVAGSTRGAVPKDNVRLSRHKRKEGSKKKDEETLEEMFLRLSGLSEDTGGSQDSTDDEKLHKHCDRIQRLEDQCKSLITQVIETTENREKLEVELCQFQETLPPAQKPVPLEEYLAAKIHAPKQDPFPETTKLIGKATATADKREERLKKLEEESKQLMAKIRRTTDRSKSMKSRLEKIHSRCTLSREGSTDSSFSEDEPLRLKGSTTVTSTQKTEEHVPISSSDCQQTEDLQVPKISCEETRNGNEAATTTCMETAFLTADEIAYVKRRDERLKRLEEEGKQLLNKLSHTSERGDALSSRLDGIHDDAVGKSGVENSEEESSASSGSGPCADSTSAVGKLEEVKRRLEQSKKLLSQLSSDPDLDPENTAYHRRSRTTSRQSESESGSAEVVSAINSMASANEVNSENSAARAESPSKNRHSEDSDSQ